MVVSRPSLPTFHAARIGLIALLMTAGPAAADIVHLNDGTKLVGSVKRQPDGGWTVTDAAGKQTNVAASDVKSIDLVGSTSDKNQSDLGSLRQATANITDPKQAVARYQQFIASSSADSPSLADAKSDLAMWQDRVDRNLVRAGANWVTPDQRAAALAGVNKQVTDAAALLKGGQTTPVNALLDQALAADPLNNAALYLKGVTLLGTDQLPPARKNFEQVTAALPDHAASFNNLAVIQWKQHQQPAALLSYDHALLADPGERVLLDNVAEALGALTPDQQKLPVAKKLADHFAAQDQTLAARLAATGWYRWGSRWLAAPDLARVEAAEKQVQDQVAALRRQFDDADSRIQSNQDEIDANTRSMRRMEADTYTHDQNGNVIRLPLPASYYQLQRDNDDLTSRTQQEQAKQADLRKQAAAVKQTQSFPRFTGVQRPIGVEGMPPLATASTQAATPTLFVPGSLSQPLPPLAQPTNR